MLTVDYWKMVLTSSLGTNAAVSGSVGDTFMMKGLLLETVTKLIEAGS